MIELSDPPVAWERYHRRLASLLPVQGIGRVTQIVGPTLESRGPAARLGDLCRVETQDGGLLAEVVGFRQETLLLMPLGRLGAVRPGARVLALGWPLTVPVGEGLLGRVIDPLGAPLDGGSRPDVAERYPVHRAPPPAMQRPRIRHVLPFGVRAIDALLTVGRGQRLGIFAGSGVGKSTLLGAIARHATADVNVVALVGERGREVREFVERDLGDAGLARSVVVVATSDEPAVVRLKGALAATAVAEYFRDQGAHVLLMMDSVTRFAWAQREVGLAIGEPPTTRGYTPSVFAALPQLLERAGESSRGSITGLYTVLVEGDDLNEPVADTTRGILDGHLVLRRELAAEGHFPAIDVLESVSRCMSDLVGEEHQTAAQALRASVAVYRSTEDLIRLGAYVAGSDPRVDRAIEQHPRIRQFLRQPPEERAPWDTTIAELRALCEC